MQIEEILEEVKAIQEEIVSAKEDKAKEEGALSEHMKILKSLGSKSVADGIKKSKVIQKEINNLETKIKDKFSILRESYEW